MKRYLCFLLIVLMSLSFVLVSCSPETKTEEKKEETYTDKNATDVATDVGTAGLAVADAVNTLALKTQPCTLTVDIKSTTDKNMSLGSTETVAAGSSNLSFREVTAASSSGYQEIKLTYDIGAATKNGLNQIATKLASGTDYKTFKRDATNASEKLTESELYKEFKNLFSNNELSFRGSLLTKILTQVKDSAPEVTVEILVGENGKNGKLTVTAGLSGSGNDIKVTVTSAVLKDKDKKTILSTEGAVFSVVFDDDFDVILKIESDAIKFSSVNGGVTVSIDKMDVKTNYLLSKTYGVAGSIKWNFTTKKLDSSLTVKGEKLDAGFSVKAELKDKNSAVSSLVNGLEVTKLSFDGTDFDTESINTVLKTRREIIVKALESYLDGSAISSLSTVLK